MAGWGLPSTGGAEAMIRGMAPKLVPGRAAFRSVPEGEAADLLGNARAIVREADGVSLIVPLDDEDDDPQAMRQITLGVLSALDGIGLTAAVSSALAARGIPCNIVAAIHHDHVFVPEDRAEEALEALRRLSGSGDVT